MTYRLPLLAICLNTASLFFHGGSAASQIQTVETPSVDGCIFVYETYPEWAEKQAELHSQSLWDGPCIDGKANGQGIRILKIGTLSKSSLESRLDGRQIGLARAIAHVSGELIGIDESFYDHGKRSGYAAFNLKTRLPTQWPPTTDWAASRPMISRYKEGLGTVTLRLEQGRDCKGEFETAAEAATKMCMVRNEFNMAEGTNRNQVLEPCNDNCLDVWIRTTTEFLDEMEALVRSSGPAINAAVSKRATRGARTTTLAERMRAPGMADKRAAWEEAVVKNIQAAQAAKRELRQDELEIAAAKRVVEDGKRASVAPALRPAADYPSMNCRELYTELHNILVRSLYLKKQADSKGFLSGLTTFATVIAFGMTKTSADVHKASAEGLTEALAGQAKVFDAEDGASKNESVALEKRAKLMRQLINASRCERD